MLNSQGERVYTRAEIMDILEGVLQKERRYCERYCEMNPGTSSERRASSLIYQDAIFAAMASFNERSR